VFLGLKYIRPPSPSLPLFKPVPPVPFSICFLHPNCLQPRDIIVVIGRYGPPLHGVFKHTSRYACRFLPFWNLRLVALGAFTLVELSLRRTPPKTSPLPLTVFVKSYTQRICRGVLHLLYKLLPPDPADYLFTRRRIFLPDLLPPQWELDYKDSSTPFYLTIMIPGAFFFSCLLFFFYLLEMLLLSSLNQKTTVVVFSCLYLRSVSGQSVFQTIFFVDLRLW